MRLDLANIEMGWKLWFLPSCNDASNHVVPERVLLHEIEYQYIEVGDTYRSDRKAIQLVKCCQPTQHLVPLEQ